jgi:hypothetical protein
MLKCDILGMDNDAIGEARGQSCSVFECLRRVLRNPLVTPYALGGALVIGTKQR